MAVSRSVLLLSLGILSFGAIPFTTAAVVVLIDAYPNTPQVSQGTTVVMVCHVSGVPSDTMVTYQWSCPNYGCGARDLQSDGNIVSRREEGNMIAIDVVNDTDSGDYTCSVRSSGTVLGTATYRISNVQAGLVLTGKNGMIPLNSFFTSNFTVLSPFEGAAGEYIRCGSTGGQPGWYNEADDLVPMSTTLNIHFNSAPDTCELWFDTMTTSTINREFQCSPQSGSLTNLSSVVGLFFLHQNRLDGTPRPTITSTTEKSITLSWSPVTNDANGYYISYRCEDLSISLPPAYIRSRGNQNRSVTLQDLEPGASYRINVWDYQYICCVDHKISSPFEMTVTTSESAPTAPRLLTVVRSTSTSVDLNWIPPHHPNGVIHYEVEYSTSENFVDSTTINTANTYHTVSDVPEFPRLYFRVVAVNSAGAGRSSSSNVAVCLGMYPNPPTEVMVEGIDTTSNVVVSWTPPTRGALTCSGGVTYTVTISTSTGGVIVQNVTSTNTTVNVCSCAVTAVSVVAVNSIGSSKPGVWTVPAMVHGEPIDSSGSIVGGFFGGFGLASGIATVVVILLFCYMKRKIDESEKNINKSPAKPEEYTGIEVTANPSYQSVEVKLDKQKDNMTIVKSVDTYF